MRKKYIAPLLLSLLCIAGGVDGKADLEVLGKALEKALGAKTDYGARRVISLEQYNRKGTRYLLVGIRLNRHFTAAGLRHNALADTAAVLRTASSWGWEKKAEKIVLLEDLIPKGERRPQLFFSCSISAEALAKVDWDSVNPKEIPQYLEDAVFHKIRK